MEGDKPEQYGSPRVTVRRRRFCWGVCGKGEGRRAGEDSKGCERGCGTLGSRNPGTNGTSSKTIGLEPCVVHEFSTNDSLSVSVLTGRSPRRVFRLVEGSLLVHFLPVPVS